MNKNYFKTIEELDSTDFRLCPSNTTSGQIDYFMATDKEGTLQDVETDEEHAEFRLDLANEMIYNGSAMIGEKGVVGNLTASDLDG